MAVCDPCRCKFFTAVPCCDKDAGAFGFLFCFCSKPRCRFCQRLYDQQVICPWHWLKSGQKTSHISSSESCAVGGVMPLIGKFVAAPLKFVLDMGSAHHRRDLNQAVKGVVNFALFSVGLSSILFLGPIAIIFFAIMCLTDPIIDWFFMGRCDDCWEYRCTGCLGCCFGGSLKEGEMPTKSKELRAFKKSRSKQMEEYGAVPEQEMMDDEGFRQQLEAEEGAEGGSGACAMICCFCCLLILAGVGYGMYSGATAAAAGLNDLAEQHGVNITDMAGTVGDGMGISSDAVTGKLNLANVTSSAGLYLT